MILAKAPSSVSSFPEFQIKDLLAAAAVVVAGFEHRLHEHDVFTRCPALLQPKGSAFGVVGEKEQIALLNLVRGEPGQTLVYERTADALFPVRTGHGQMMQVAATSVMSAKHCAYDHAFCYACD